MDEQLEKRDPELEPGEGSAGADDRMEPEAPPAETASDAGPRPPSPGARAADPAEGEAAAAEPAEALPLEELPEAATPAGPGPEAGPAVEASELGVKLAYRGSGGRNDGSAEIGVSEDRMTALATFIPPMGDGLPLTIDLIHELLARMDIVAGVLWDEIAEAIMRCNLDRHLIRDMPIARGSEPVPEIPEHAELLPKFREHRGPVPDDAQRVDFREMSSIVVVAKNELVARLVSRRDGVPGTDVRGKTVPFPRTAVENCVPGRNVERRSEGLVALVDGKLTLAGNRLDVDEALLVKGAVDFHTGHIVFPGDVVIEGAVKDGFKVHSGGSIVCKSTIDAFDINAKKDLTCSQGIIGRRRAQVRVGGELKAKFIQNCHVAVRGNVQVAAAVVNCRLFSLGSVDLGDKGVLMGGEVFAVHGIRCGRLGNQAFQRTSVHVGIDFTVQQQLDRSNEQLRLMTLRQKQVEEAAAGRPGPGFDRAKAEVAKAIADLRALISRLVGAIDADEAAVLEVKGEVFPGTVIEICHVSINVEEPLKACRFRLDKAKGRIVVDR